MSLDCTQLVEQTIQRLRVDFHCEPAGRFVSVVTPYLYPDNSLIEIFVEETREGWVRVSDLGETFRHLKLQGADPLSSVKGRFMAAQTVERLHVTLVRGMLEKSGDSATTGELLLDVAAAAQALSGLIYTSRASEPATFPQEVRSFLEEKHVEFTARDQIEGLSGRMYRVGFHFWSPTRRRDVLLEPLSPAQEGGMNALMNRTVRMWVDVNGSRLKVSLLNDLDYEWRREDSILLERLSTVALWSQRERLLETVDSPI